MKVFIVCLAIISAGFCRNADVTYDDALSDLDATDGTVDLSADGRRCPTTLTKKRVENIKQALKAIVFDDKIAHAVRISFHDCVGGCDGCINVNNPDNFGPMLQTLQKLNDLYDAKNYKRFLSRADLYALAGVFAIEEGVRNANIGCTSSCIPTPHFDYKYCRQDCPTSPDTTVVRSFPQGPFNHSQTMKYFSSNFGLDPRLTTALLGAHTLGGASGSSGFKGFWKEDANQANKFDNRYYTLLADTAVSWTQVDEAPITMFPKERWQWNGFKGGNMVSFMLQADVELLLDVTTNAKGKSACNFNTCRDAQTADLVRKYAKNAAAWIADFVPAFQTVINNGCEARLVRPNNGSKG